MTLSHPIGRILLSYQNIIVEEYDGIGVITLNRPKVLNALSRNLYFELDTAISNMELNPEVKVIIITGSGQRAFSAGADIHEMARLAKETDTSRTDSGKCVHQWHMAVCKKPTIGAINGLAYGGGALMASSLDIRIGCENTSFKFLAASYGSVNSTWSLPMQVGWPIAKELLLTARVVEANEAYRIGLLNHIVPSEQLMTKALEIATLIASNDGSIIQGIKKLMIDAVGNEWSQAYENEMEAQQNDLKPPPVLEGFKEFLDRKGMK